MKVHSIAINIESLRVDSKGIYPVTTTVSRKNTTIPALTINPTNSLEEEVLAILEKIKTRDNFNEEYVEILGMECEYIDGKTVTLSKYSKIYNKGVEGSPNNTTNEYQIQ